MRFLFFLPLLSAAPLMADSYLDFHRYVYSRPVKYNSTDNLSHILKSHGYDRDRNWVKITLYMNGLSEADLQNPKIKSIYLPPKLSYQDYLKSRQRIPASERPACYPVSRKFIEKKYGKASIAYIDYFDLITSRKIKVKRGQSLDRIVAGDQFSYQSIERGVRLVKEANNLSGNVIKEDRVIYMPFCVTQTMLTKIGKRPASVSFKGERIQRKLERKSLPSKSSLNYSLGLGYGAVDVKRNAENISGSFSKISASVSSQLNSQYTLSGHLTGAFFLNMSHSDSKQTSNSSGLYPEFGATLSRTEGHWQPGISYDMLNYFVIKNDIGEVNLEPNKLHRLSFKTNFSISDSVGVFGGPGYLQSLDSEKISGYDLTLGASYKFGQRDRYSFSLVGNKNYLSTNESSKNDESTAWLGTLKINF